MSESEVQRPSRPTVPRNLQWPTEFYAPFHRHLLSAYSEQVLGALGKEQTESCALTELPFQREGW